MCRNLRIVETVYDGFIVVLNEDGIEIAYEGKACCPKRLQKWLEENEPEKQFCFYYEAV